MAFATGTFGNTNPHSGFALRRKKSRGVSPGTVVTGVAVVAFAWVAATVLTTQSMVLSLPGSDMYADAALAPRASAFIVPQGRPIRATHFVGQTSAAPLHASLPADAPIRGAGYTPTKDMVVAMPTATTPRTARIPLPEHAVITPPQNSPVLAKGGRLALPLSPAKSAHLQLQIALTVTNTAHSWLASNAAAAQPTPAAPTQNVASVPKETAPTEAVVVARTKDDDLPPLPAAADELSIAENLPSVVPQPLARPDDVLARVPADDDDADKKAATLPTEIASNESAMTQAEDDEDDLPSFVPQPLARPDHIVERAPAAPAAQPDRTDSPPSRVLAYAQPEEDGGSKLRSLFSPSPAVRNGVAIYDIEAKTVYLPSGERLEAHSGLGYMHDNPRYVNQKNRGPTPPHTYDLTLRESLFHGVQALRLTPTDGGGVYGRTGLLAHTYMLGPRGDSNGCVSFKDYRRFLAAYRRGEIKRLVVVAHLSSVPVNMASR